MGTPRATSWAPDRSDAMAEEIAVVLASGLVSVLRREIDQQAEKKTAELQTGPVSFGYDGELRILEAAALPPDVHTG